MIRLHLVRHGATDWSQAGRFNGTTDVPLNETGRAQAAAVAAQLKGATFAGVWTSELARSRETTRLAWGAAEVDARLREFDFGAIEGLRWDDLDPQTRSALVEFDDFAAPGGETVAQLYERIDSFLAKLGDGDHLVFTHGGVIRALLRRAERDEAIATGGLVVLEVE